MYYFDLQFTKLLLHTWIRALTMDVIFKETSISWQKGFGYLCNGFDLSCWKKIGCQRKRCNVGNRCFFLSFQLWKEIYCKPSSLRFIEERALLPIASYRFSNFIGNLLFSITPELIRVYLEFSYVINVQTWGNQMYICNLFSFKMWTNAYQIHTVQALVEVFWNTT